MGIWACPGHLGGTGCWLQPHGPDGDQVHCTSLLPQQVGVIRSLLSCNHDGCQRRAGGFGPGCWVPAKGMEWRVKALPRAEHGELQYCCQQQSDTAHRLVPSVLYTGALTVLRGGPDTIPVSGPHRVRGPQLQHLLIIEPAHSTGRGFADGDRDGGPHSPLPTVLVVPPHEDLVTGVTR